MTEDLQTADVARVADAASRGGLIREGERHGLRYVRHYPHPVDRVWRAITASDQLRHWMPCDIVGERTAGAAITLPFWPGHVEKYAIDEPTLTGRIEVWEPPRRFVWTWGGDLLIFELTSVDDGTAWSSPPGRRIRIWPASSAPPVAITSASPNSPCCWTPARRRR